MAALVVPFPLLDSNSSPVFIAENSHEKWPNYRSYPIPIFANSFSPEFLLLKFSEKSHHSHLKPWFLPWFLHVSTCFNSMVFAVSTIIFHHFPSFFPVHTTGPRFLCAGFNPCLETGAAPRFGSGSVGSVESFGALRFSSKRVIFIGKKEGYITIGYISDLKFLSLWISLGVVYLVANYPRIVSGLVHPNYKWIKRWRYQVLTIYGNGILPCMGYHWVFWISWDIGCNGIQWDTI